MSSMEGIDEDSDSFSESIDDFTDDITSDLTDNATDDLTDNATDDLTDNVTDDLTDNVADDLTDNVANELTDNVINDTTDVVNDTTKYEANGYEYEMNDMGQITKASGDLRLEEGERNQYAQRIAGGEFRHQEDDGGHLIGARFGGSGELDNLIPEDKYVNRVEYKSLEDQWADEIINGNDVYVEIEPVYHGDSLRPDIITGKTEIRNGDDTKVDYFSMTNENLNEDKFNIDDNPLLDSFPDVMDDDNKIYGSNDIDF